jgi:fatty-acyl-CoA synthase
VIDLCTVSGALAAAASTPRGIRAIEHDGRSLLLPYAALLADSLQLAGALHARGLAPGERVALVIPEVSDFLRAFFGISSAGLVPVPLCPPAQAGDLPTFARQSRHVLAASRARAVVTTADVAPLLDLPAGRVHLSRDHALGRQADQADPCVLLIDALRAGPPLTQPAPVAVDAPALLQFTSGSTAAPKGVVLTHANLHANISAIVGPRGVAVTSSDVGVSWLPLYHDMGLIGMLLSAVYSRNDVIIMSPVLFLKRPTAWLEAISTYRASVSFAPNFAYELCLRRVKPSQIGALDLSSWRVAGCGAEPIRLDTLRSFAEHFAAAGFRASSIVSSYGLAEHSLAVAFARGGVTVDTVDAERLVRQSVAIPAVNGSAPVMRLVGCGGAFPDHELEIVDEEGRPLPERHVGAILARGPSVMHGYFENPTATAEALRDGWLHTGDLGYIAGGQLFVCGRTKDLIIHQGRKYHPPDLESAIADLPGVRTSGVVVFGINRIDDDDEVVAVLEARASAASDDVVEQVRRRVRETAGLELDHVVVAPPGTIPRTTSGKVRRVETRERFEAGTLVAR